MVSQGERSGPSSMFRLVFDSSQLCLLSTNDVFAFDSAACFFGNLKELLHQSQTSLSRGGAF